MSNGDWGTIGHKEDGGGSCEDRNDADSFFTPSLGVRGRVHGKEWQVTLVFSYFPVTRRFLSIACIFLLSPLSPFHVLFVSPLLGLTRWA